MRLLHNLWKYSPIILVAEVGGDLEEAYANICDDHWFLGMAYERADACAVSDLQTSSAVLKPDWQVNL